MCVPSAEAMGTDPGGQASSPEEEIVAQSPRPSRQKRTKRREGHSGERGRHEQDREGGHGFGLVWESWVWLGGKGR